jgi:hypothetical protein
MGHLETVPGATSRDRYNEAEQHRVREQVARICESPLFNQSKRYPAFLKYIVEETLKGHPEDLKERTIGVEVFHRSSDYDSNADPAVRIAAGEIRKRLAQYYYEPGHEEELRIELPTGSYVPSFRPPAAATATAGRTIWSPKPSQEGERNSIGRRLVWGIALAGLVALISFISYSHNRPRQALKATPRKAITSRFDQFWDQVVVANGPVQLCLGGWIEQEPTGPGLAVTLTSYRTMSKMTDLLESRKKRYLNTLHVIGPDATHLSGFLDGPVVYLGYYKPIAPMMASWRYSFEKETDTRTIWVHDRESVFEKQWRTEMVPPQQRTESYAIVARLLDRDLKRPVIIVAGIHSFATVGGVEVLTNPVYMNDLLKDAPPDWRDMNFQAVVETRLENDHPAPPKILATHFWR